MKRNADKLSSALRLCGLPESLFVRLLTAYFAVSSVLAIFARRNGVNPVGEWKDYVGGISLASQAIWTFLLFLWISVIYVIIGKRVPKLDFTLLGIFSVFFSFCAVWCSGSFYFGAAASAIAAVIVVYSLGRLGTASCEKLPQKMAGAVVFAAAGVVFLFTAVTTVLNHRNFGTSCFDMGIFVQTFHSLRENLTAVITCERDRFMSHFQVHTSYFFYLFLPVYALFPYPETLLTGQALFAIGGVLPLYLIAKRRGYKGWALVSACCLYVFCSGLIMPCYYSFHENAFLPTLLLWLLWAAESENIPLFYVMSVLVCSVKEDAPLYVFCIGIWFLIEKKGTKRLHGLIAAALSAGYFIVVMRWLTANGDGEYMTSTRLGILMADSGEGIAGIVSNALIDPAYLISLMLNADTLLFFAETLLPLLLLPFATDKPHRLILAIPYVIMNLIIGSGYVYAAQIGFQYVFGPICLMIYLAVINASEFSHGLKDKVIIAAAVVTAVTTVSMASQKLSVIKEHRVREDFYDSAEQCLRGIPQDGSVMANTFFLPHIADRDEVYELDDEVLIKGADGQIVGIKELEKYDYIALSRLDPLTEEIAPILEAQGWSVYSESDGFVVVYTGPVG